jgi:hypothetical protein
MEYFLALLLAPALGFQFLKMQDQRRRILLLAQHLNQHQIEKLMQTVTEGYLRALDAKEQVRREQIWASLQGAEQDLGRQFKRFAEDFAKVWNDQTQVSTLGWAFPYADKLFPRQTFDMRSLLVVHAEGIGAVVDNPDQRSPRDKAYTLMAELLLMQHSCHWFCRSRAVADARMVTRHQTRHAQLLEAVSPGTRAGYVQVTGINKAQGVKP